MSVSEIGHSGRYVINFYFHKARQNHYSFPETPKDLEELKKMPSTRRAPLLQASYDLL